MNSIKDVLELEKLDFSIMKQSSINYWKQGRRFSDDKINLIIEHRKGYDMEFRSTLLEEVEKVLDMK